MSGSAGGAGGMFERAIRRARGPFARSDTVFVSERAIRGLTGAVARSDRSEGIPVSAAPRTAVVECEIALTM